MWNAWLTCPAVPVKSITIPLGYTTLTVNPCFSSQCVSLSRSFSETPNRVPKSAALSQHIGLWAPGACPAEPPPAGVEAFVKSTAEQAQVATTAVDILHQQTLSASGPGSGLSQPRWRQGTAYAVAELQASAGALASASPGGPVQPLAQRFASIGRDLLAGADSYASASDLAEAMRRASVAHGEHEQRIGAADPDWPAWYAAYMVAEQSGSELPT